MPTYEYACRSCGEHLEVVQSFKDDPLTTCPNCQGALRKVFSAAGIIFKGSGWHIKDYASKSGSSGGASGSEAASGPDSSPGSTATSSDGGKEAKTDAKSDTGTKSGTGTKGGTDSGSSAKSA